MAKSQVQLNKISECKYDLFKFAKLINPHYVYGDIHEKVFSWLANPEASQRQLLLLPRGHLKSHCVAVYCVHNITYNPWTSIVYLAASEDLAKAQLFAIKQMMTSPTYTSLWPEMFSEEKGHKGERGVWSAFAFDVDHPERKKRGIRDHTMLIKTVKSNAVGLHCEGLVFDDVVVPDYADTQNGRSILARSLGYYSSILNAGGWVKAVGTRYHPEDAYQSMIDARSEVWDEEAGDFVKDEPLWQVLEEVVEDSYDRSGTGRFLWPRTESPVHEGQWFGFNPQELAKIKADYQSHKGAVHFYSQYYNDPNDVGTQRISRGSFQYYDEKFLEVRDGKAFFERERLNVYAAMDVAWTENTKSDYTAIAVIGINHDGFIYVLDLDRFRTSNFQTYYERIQQLQDQWGFRRLVVETNAGGRLVAQEVEAFVRRNGGSLVVERRSHTVGAGNKQERWAAVIEPRYESKSVWHRRGGLTAVLEEELISAKPRHDDLKDALTTAVSVAVPPSGRRLSNYKKIKNTNIAVGRFGGRVRVK